MEHLEKKLDKMDEKLDAVVENTTRIDKTLVGQAAQLEHHIYRTDLAEQHIKVLELQIIPLMDFQSKFNGVMKVTGVIATGLTLAVGIIKILTELFK